MTSTSDPLEDLVRERFAALPVEAQLLQSERDRLRADLFGSTVRPGPSEMIELAEDSNPEIPSRPHGRLLAAAAVVLLVIALGLQQRRDVTATTAAGFDVIAAGEEVTVALDELVLTFVQLRDVVGSTRVDHTVVLELQSDYSTSASVVSIRTIGALEVVRGAVERFEAQGGSVDVHSQAGEGLEASWTLRSVEAIEAFVGCPVAEPCVQFVDEAPATWIQRGRLFDVDVLRTPSGELVLVTRSEIRPTVERGPILLSADLN